MSEGAVFTGDNMLWATVATTVIVPNIPAWVRGEAGFHVSLHDWAVLLGVLGAAIGLMGCVLARANSIKADNEQIV